MFVQLRPAFTTHNNNAAWQLQSGLPSLQPVWQHGLRGEGQLLSVGDTGIHPNSCFFSPASAREAVQSTIRSGAAVGSCNLLPLLNLSAPSPHPKLHAYLRYTSTDFTDVVEGHGTHVCGSASGSSGSPQLSAFNGMAPASKMVFIDLDKDGVLIVPDDLSTDYFPCVYQAGARISSNSWGADDNVYDLYASSMDAFVHAHDDLLVLVAAGNEGAKGEYTVGTPATAKNILAVGAVTSAIVTDCRNCIFNPNSITFAVGGSNVSFIPAPFGADVCSLSPRSIPLYRPPPQEAGGCQNFAADTCARMTGNAVVLSRGICTFVDKSQRAFACAASVVIIVNINDDKPLLMSGTGQMVNVPVFSVGRQFSAVAAAITGPFIDVASSTARVLAQFSSRGPTRDGRMKPDIVAPGSPIYSSNAVDSPNSCTAAGTCPSSSAPPNVAAKSGTSMATPLVAGTAALMRQYLAEGFYPGGFRGSDRSVDPSAALMRALIIGSSRSTLQPTQKLRSMQPFAQDETPSFAQGWGAPVAAAVLPFANATAPFRSFSLKLFDRWPISAETAPLSAQFLVSRDASPLTVTLAWTDPPSLPAADNRGVLVNDIDLLLVSPQGQLYAGNAIWSIQLAPTAIRVALPDSSNNQEQVHVPAAAAGVWGVHVRASRMVTSSQLVAVAITGEGQYVPGAAPDRCSSWCRGSCTSADTCQCSGAQWGSACDGVVVDIPIVAAFGSYSEDVSLAVQGWRYYRFAPSLLGSTLDVFMFSSGGDPDVFMSDDDQRVPDALHNMHSDERCDSCGDVVPNEECDPCVDDICREQSGCFTANRITTRQAIIVGVRASCCSPTSFKIKFTAQSNDTIIAVAISGLLALIFSFFAFRYRHRIAAFARRVASSCRRSTSRPRLPPFPSRLSNIFTFRHGAVSLLCARQRDTSHRRRAASDGGQGARAQQLPTLPRPRRQGYSTLSDGACLQRYNANRHLSFTDNWRNRCGGERAASDAGGARA